MCVSCSYYEFGDRFSFSDAWTWTCLMFWLFTSWEFDDLCPLDASTLFLMCWLSIWCMWLCYKSTSNPGRPLSIPIEERSPNSNPQILVFYKISNPISQILSKWDPITGIFSVAWELCLLFLRIYERGEKKECDKSVIRVWWKCDKSSVINRDCAIRVIRVS